jgi:hypothetical protein
MKKTILTLMVTVTSYYYAQATFLPVGGTVVPGAIGPLPGATLLASHVGEAFTSSIGDFTGTATVAVYSDPLNVFGAGHLDFVYQVHNNASSTASLERLTMTHFAGFLTDVSFTLTGSAIPGGIFVDGTATAFPATADRTTADVVGFNFPGGASTNHIMPGQTSTVVIIETDATTFTSGFLSVINGGVATVDAFSPATPAPDGGSAVTLLGIALAGIEGVRRMFRARRS